LLFSKSRFLHDSLVSPRAPFSQASAGPKNAEQVILPSWFGGARIARLCSACSKQQFGVPQAPTSHCERALGHQSLNDVGTRLKKVRIVRDVRVVRDLRNVRVVQNSRTIRTSERTSTRERIGRRWKTEYRIQNTEVGGQKPLLRPHRSPSPSQPQPNRQRQTASGVVGRADVIDPAKPFG
jgi:hypothetical protein